MEKFGLCFWRTIRSGTLIFAAASLPQVKNHTGYKSKPLGLFQTNSTMNTNGITEKQFACKCVNQTL